MHVGKLLVRRIGRPMLTVKALDENTARWPPDLCTAVYLIRRLLFRPALFAV